MEELNGFSQRDELNVFHANKIAIRGGAALVAFMGRAKKGRKKQTKLKKGTS